MPQMKVCGIKNAAIAQMVEHVIGNDEVSSSNLLSSSKIPITKVVGIFLFPIANNNPDVNFTSGIFCVYGCSLIRVSNCVLPSAFVRVMVAVLPSLAMEKV